MRVVFLHAYKIGVTGSRCGFYALRNTLMWGHLILPLLPFRVADKHGHWATESSSESHPAKDLELVAFKPHTWPSAESEAPTRQFGANAIDCDTETGGKALDGRDETRTVRLAGGEKSKHDDTE